MKTLVGFILGAFVLSFITLMLPWYYLSVCLNTENIENFFNAIMDKAEKIMDWVDNC